jgi:transcriptional regulator with XRE-family HTH domain
VSSRYELDIGRLADAIETIKRHRGISARKVAEETGLSPSTLTRLSQGQKPDADALVSLLAWLQTDAALFTRPRAGDMPSVVAELAERLEPA